MIHFFIGIVTCVEIDKALQSSVLLIIFKFLLSLAFLSVVCNLLEHEGKDIGGCNGILLDGLVYGLHVFIVLFFIRSCESIDFRDRFDGFLVFTKREKHLLYLCLVEVDVGIIYDILDNVSLAVERVVREALGRRDVVCDLGVGASH